MPGGETCMAKGRFGCPTRIKLTDDRRALVVSPPGLAHAGSRSLGAARRRSGRDEVSFGKLEKLCTH